MTSSVQAAAWKRLESVHDPELRVPITQLGMVSEISELSSGPLGAVLEVKIKLTIAGCPMRSTIQSDVEQALSELDEVAGVSVVLDVMTPEDRKELIEALRHGRQDNPFNPQPTASGAQQSKTRVIAVASGKGGVGKSSITANLAVGLAAQGLRVGLIDADIHGFSIPGLLGIRTKPTRLDSMILPPVAHGVKVMSIGMFLDTEQPVAWRGPMLHRALEQFIKDVYWGPLDMLLVDLPPGTGDIAISVAQLLPTAEILVVTTPQHAAAHVAIRAGQLAAQTEQHVVGVVENMGPMTLPDGTDLELFGSGGGQRVATQLSTSLNRTVPLLGSVPLDTVMRADGDAGTPTVLAHPEGAGARQLKRIIETLALPAQP